MKKIFTMLFAATAVAGSYSSNAQTIFKEDFEGVTTPALPSGWTQQTPDTADWATRTGGIAFPGSATGWNTPAHSKYAIVDDWTPGTIKNDSITLVTPNISLTGISGATLTFQYCYFGAQRTSTGKSESAFVVASTNGGTSWAVIDTLKGSPSAWQSRYLDLTAYNNTSNLKIGFMYKDNAQQLIGLSIDNVEVFKPYANDVKVQAVSLPKITTTDFVAANGSAVGFSVLNRGSAAITSLDMQYVVDAGTPVTQTITGLNIAPYTESNIDFSSKLSGLTGGAHSVDVKANQVNGGVDANPLDNMQLQSFIAPSNSLQKAGLIEEFSSSTCAPCKSFNQVFDPLVLTNNPNNGTGTFNIIKYQMNWPTPFNDVSYNAHGDSRKTYYDVQGIPDHYTNGMPGGNGDQAEIDACQTETAFMKINGTYTSTFDSVFMHVEVTPYFSLTGNFRVYTAIVENTYDNKGNTTGQLHYYNVMRKMFPDGDGKTVTTWADNTMQSFDYTDAPKTGTVKQGSFTLWNSQWNTTLLVFVQDFDSKIILQSKAIKPAWPASIQETAAGLSSRLGIYPNPATDNATVDFSLAAASHVQVQLVDAMGRITTIADQDFAAGSNKVNINTAALAAGLYIVKVQTEKGAITERLTVAK